MAVSRPVLERFLRYVKINTQSAEDGQSIPSSQCQWDLINLLKDELTGMGVASVSVNLGGVLTAEIPSNMGADGDRVPVIAFMAHVDTYHGTSGKDVKPQVIEGYDGRDIVLSGTGKVLKVADNPDLKDYVGQTVITTDGTTLLGADDKAGVAEIMTFVEHLLAHPELKHGKVKIAFTPDEEIGRGTASFPKLEDFGAHVAYTMDGGKEGEVENETFCADSATVVLRGQDVHPGYAKGKMVNAVRAAAHLITLLPGDALPETTEGKQGYLHPLGTAGDVNKTDVQFIVRDFEMDGLKRREAVLESLCAKTREAFPGLETEIKISHSYKNMKYYLDKEPRAIALAMQATRNAGVEPLLQSIRGGTDGSRLSEQGLPTPNLSAGGRNFHSVNEWVPLNALEKAVRVMVELTALWAKEQK
jgi:tripeptide aminopeptidase